MKVLMVLDLPTFRGSPQYEVPTRSHTVWCGSPICYDGPVSIILKICLRSCFLSHDSGILSLQTTRFLCLVSAQCNLCLISFTTEGESESDSQVEREQFQLSQRHTTQQDMHKFWWSIPHRCGSHKQNRQHVHHSVK